MSRGGSRRPPFDQLLFRGTSCEFVDQPNGPNKRSAKSHELTRTTHAKKTRLLRFLILKSA
jgi:hypothetical protein